MAGIKDKMGREAFSVGFEYAYSKLEKDKKQGALDLLQLAKKYLDKGKLILHHNNPKKGMNPFGNMPNPRKGSVGKEYLLFLSSVLF